MKVAVRYVWTAIPSLTAYFSSVHLWLLYVILYIHHPHYDECQRIIVVQAKFSTDI